MIQTAFYDWQANRSGIQHNACSPNLTAIRHELVRRWPFFTHQGCYNARPIRGSTTVASSHSFGAALDLGYPPDRDQEIEQHVAGFLVAWSREAGIQAVHDYRRCRIWRAGRTPNIDEACTAWWKAQRPSSSTGMGQVWANHIHIETDPISWALATDLPSRGIL